MTETITVWVLSALGYLCTAPAATGGAGDHTVAGPLLGNVLVAGGAGLVILVCIMVALWMLIAPGEHDPNHPKYRVLDTDR
jgi:ascorbate-specific PTS system EIIC-type component UlaA